MQSDNCPICNELINRLERYPKTVCKNCLIRAVDVKGNRVVFLNGNSGDGFESHHFDKKGRIRYIKQNHICYIDDKKCEANESRFGGIVVQLI